MPKVFSDKAFWHSAEAVM